MLDHRTPKRLLLALSILVTSLLIPNATNAQTEIVGRVDSFSGSALADARVSLFAAEDRATEARLRELGTLRPDPLATTRTNDDGGFVLVAPDLGPFTVVAEAPGHTPWELPLVVLEPTALPTVTLGKVRNLTLRVADADDQPLEGALATVDPRNRQGERRPESGIWLPAAQLERSDPDGVLHLRRTAVRSLDLLVWAPGFLEAAIPSGKVESRTVRLRRGVRRSIEVRDADGTPRAGVVVEVGRGSWVAGRTDEHGRLELTAPANRPLPLELITAEGHRTATQLAPTAPDDPLGKVQTIDLETRGIGGRVVEAESGEPLAGALVWPQADRGTFAWTDARGAFTLPSTPPADPTLTRAVLFADAVGHLAQYLPEIPEAPAATQIALPAAHSLAGIVVDPGGRPVIGAEIQAHGDLGRNPFLAPPLPVLARSDADGRFRLPKLANAAEYELITRAQGYAGRRHTVSGADVGGELRLTLEAGRTALGRVLDGEGRGVAGAAAVLFPSRRSERQDLLIDDVHLAHSRDDGRFVQTQVLPGPYDLGVTAPGFAPARIHGLDVEDGSEPFDLGTVVLEPEAVLTGRVTDPEEQPLPGVEVSFLSMVYEIGPQDDQLSTMKVTRTDREGRFTLQGLGRGQTVDLKFKRRGFESRSVFAVEAPNLEPLTVVLEPTLSLGGRVVDEEGKPVAHARVKVDGAVVPGKAGSARFGPDPGLGSHTADAQGRFSVMVPGPGRYTLSARAEGFLRSAKESVEVRGDNSVDRRTLVLGRGARLEGRVLAPDGRPLQNARLAVIEPAPAPGETRIEATSGGNGGYRLAGLPRGRATVEILHPNHPRGVRDVTIDADLVDLDLTLEEGVEVSGRVTDGGRTPVAGARLRLSGSGQGRKNATSSADGSFRFSGVPVGRHQLAAAKEGHAETSLEVWVEATGVVDGPLEVELGRGGAVRGRLLGLDPELWPQVRIAAQHPGRGTISAVADPGGEYRLTPLGTGEWTVAATLRGDASRRVARRVRIDEGAAEPILDLDFAAGVALSGEVTIDGRPVAGALVSLAGGGDGTPAEHRGVRTGPEGGFVVQDLDPGVYTLGVTDLESGRSSRRAVELDTDQWLAIELEATRLRGRVVDARGRGIAEARVEADATDALAAGLRPRARTDGNGAFVLDGISPGTWRLLAHGPGTGRGETTVDVSVGSGSDDLEIVLEGGGEATLHVLTASGQPARRIDAVVLDGDGQTVTAGSFSGGASGRVRIPDLPEGSFEVHLSVAGEEAAQVAIQIPGPPTTVQLSETSEPGD